MRYRFVLLLIFLCSSGMLFAQKDHTISLTEVDKPLHLNGYYISDLIVLLEDEAYIGRVMLGGANNPVPARLGKTTKEELIMFLNKQGAMLPEGKPLTLRINELFVNERNSGASENSIIFLNVSFLEKKDESWVELFQGCASLHRSGIDVTHQHSENIASAFRKVFDDFNERSAQGKIRPYEISGSDLKVNPLLSGKNLPVFEAKRIPRGIFPSFYDFRDQYIDTEPIFHVYYKLIKGDSARMSAELEFKDRSIPDPWAFSDGKRLFVLIGKKYYPVILEKDKILCDFHPDITADQAANITTGAVIGGLLFGVVGASIGALIGSSGSYESHDTLALDFGTTSFEALNSPVARICSHSIFYLSNSMPEELSVRLLVDSTFHVTLKPGEFYDLTLGAQFSEVNVQFIANSGARYEQFINPALFKTEVYLLRVRKQTFSFTTTFGDTKQGILAKQNDKNTVKR